MNLLQEILKTLSLPEFYFAMFRSATPVLLTTLGAMISSRSGTSNIALEGTMLISAFVGVVVSAFSHSAWIGFLGAVFAGFVVSNILAYFILKLNSNRIKHVCIRRNDLRPLSDHGGKRRIHIPGIFKTSEFNDPGRKRHPGDRCCPFRTSCPDIHSTCFSGSCMVYV